MAGGAQFGIWRDGHILGRMVGLERSMAGFAGNTFESIAARREIKTASRVFFYIPASLRSRLAIIGREN